MRFYKPRLREYVSTQVDMPWEFLQGVAEQKQKGYDDALATGDAANKLLNFEVIPGDMEGKQAIQNEYNDQLYQITDYVRQTGDFNTASREFSKVIRNIAQDKRIQIMTNAVPIHKEVMKSANELLEKGASFGVKADPMFRTYDPATGELKPYNQSAGYNNIEINEKYRADIENLMNNVVANAYGSESIQGDYYVDQKGEYITADRLWSLVKPNINNLMTNYSTFVNDLNKIDVLSGKKAGTTLNDIFTSAVNERVYSKSYRNINLTETAQKQFEYDLQSQSNIYFTTGESTKTEVNYTAITSDNISLNNQLKQEQEKLKGKTGKEATIIQNRIDELKAQIKTNSTKLQSVDDAMEQTGNIDKLYSEYKAGISKINVNKLTYGKKPLAPISRAEFKKYMTGAASPEFVLDMLGQKTVSDERLTGVSSLRNKYQISATEKGLAGVAATERQYVQSSKSNSDINLTNNSVKNGILDGTISALDNSGKNITDELNSIPNVDPNKSELILSKTTKSGKMEFKLIVKDTEGKVIKQSIVDVSKSDNQIKQQYNTALRLSAEKALKFNNTSDYYNILDIAGSMNYSGLQDMRENYNEDRPIKENNPIKLGNFYVYSAKNAEGNYINGVYHMTQAYYGDDGKLYYNSSAYETDADGSIELSIQDVERKLGQNVLQQTR